MLRVVGMAGQTALGSLFCAEGFEADDLADVATTLDVSLARTVASFAPLVIGRGFFVLHGREVCSALEVLE